MGQPPDRATRSNNATAPIDALSGALKAHTRHREIGYLPGCDPQDLRKDSHWTTFEI